MVGVGERRDEGVERQRRVQPPSPRRRVAEPLEDRERERVVEVGHQARPAAAQLRLHHRALRRRHHDPRAGQQRAQPHRVRGVPRRVAERGPGLRRLARRGQRDVAVRGQHAGQLRRPHGVAAHARPGAVPGQHDDATGGHWPTGYASRPYPPRPHAQVRAHHRHHRPGRLLPRGAPARATATRSTGWSAGPRPRSSTASSTCATGSRSTRATCSTSARSSTPSGPRARTRSTTSPR